MFNMGSEAKWKSCLTTLFNFKADGNQPSAPSCDLLDLESCLPAAVPKPMRTDLPQSSELSK